MYGALNNLITGNVTVSVVFILAVLVVIAALWVRQLQKMGLEAVRGEVYQAILKAEHSFRQGDNTQKFEYVVSLARSSLPMPFGLLVTERLLTEAVQLWFDLVKDLLDDGKINKSEKE